MPRNGVGGLADGKPWVSMSVSLNEFTMLTHVTFLAFGLYKCTFDTTNQLATHIICTKRSESWIIIHVWWLQNNCLLCDVGV